MDLTFGEEDNYLSTDSEDAGLSTDEEIELNNDLLGDALIDEDDLALADITL